MVNTELYRIFIAIYRAGTISKAAVLCDITQPAASQQLALLERTLKVKLFERTPRQMVATNEGHELYTKVADSFDWLDFVSQDFILQREEEESLLRIGVPLEYYTEVLTDKMQHLPFRLDVSFGTHEVLSADLYHGKIDLMISDKVIHSSSMYSEIVLSQKFYLIGSKNVMPPQNGFEYWQGVRAWVIKQKWISYDAELSLIRQYFKSQYDLQPNIKPKYIIPDTHTIMITLLKVEGVAILPDYLCKKHIENGDMVLLHQFKGNYDANLYLSYANSTKNNVLVKKFSEIMNELKSDIISS